MPSEPPRFTVQPDSSIAVPVQATTEITCSAAGFPPPSIDWLFNGNLLVPLSGNTTLQSFQPFAFTAHLQVLNSIAESALNFSALNSAFTGSYRCEAHNEQAELIVVASAPAALLVQCKLICSYVFHCMCLCHSLSLCVTRFTHHDIVMGLMALDTIHRSLCGTPTSTYYVCDGSRNGALEAPLPYHIKIPSKGQEKWTQNCRP